MNYLTFKKIFKRFQENFYQKFYKEYTKNLWDEIGAGKFEQVNAGCVVTNHRKIINHNILKSY